MNNHCILFYEIFTWYKNDKQKGVKFISETEVKAIKNVWTTCIFDNEISDKICNRFSITFQVISFGDERVEPDFDIGYTLENTIEESMKNWTSPIGEGQNKHTSTCWNCGNSRLYHSCSNGWSTVQKNLKYSLGDIFTMLFDFKEEKVKIYYNDQEKDCKDLNVTKLWVAISLFYTGNHVKVIDYKYD